MAFVATSLISARLRRKTLTDVGLLFVVLGLIAGPLALDIAPTIGSTTWSLAISALAGWVALEVGLGISLRSDGQMALGAVRAGALYTIMGVIGLSVVSFGVLEALLASSLDTNWGYGAIVIAAAGVAAAPGALNGVAAAHGADGPVRAAGTSLARISRALAIVVVTIAAAVAEPETTIVGFRALAPTERILAELMLGITLGFCADVFLSTEPDDRQMVTILVALSIMASGLSMHLGLSPLLVNLIIGSSLANYGHLSATRHRAAEALEGPSRKLLLVAMGAAWLPPVTPAVWGVIILLIGARTAMLRIAGGVAGRAFDPDRAGFRVIGLTMVAQGAPALAIALLHTHSLPQEAGSVVLSVILFSAVVNDLWAPMAARAVLDEAGEIPTTLAEV
ncbi:MAG: hypothetical protein ACPGU1_08065 [Myxococcota bacterium]